MNRNSSQLCTDFLKSLRYLQKHFDQPCQGSLAMLESEGLINFRTRSTSFVILKTLEILVKDGTRLVWNKRKYPDVTPRLANQVIELAVEKNVADKAKSKKNIEEKAREAKVFARPACQSVLSSKRSLTLISTRIL
jgi:hypothetical protein